MDKETETRVDRFMEKFVKLTPCQQDEVYNLLLQRLEDVEGTQHG